MRSFRQSPSTLALNKGSSFYSVPPTFLYLPFRCQPLTRGEELLDGRGLSWTHLHVTSTPGPIPNTQPEPGFKLVPQKWLQGAWMKANLAARKATACFCEEGEAGRSSPSPLTPSSPASCRC